MLKVRALNQAVREICAEHKLNLFDVEELLGLLKYDTVYIIVLEAMYLLYAPFLFVACGNAVTDWTGMCHPCYLEDSIHFAPTAAKYLSEKIIKGGM